MNDLTITVSGWVATDPRHIVGPSGASLTSFRLASTSRHFDRATNTWTDGTTEWFTVRVFRGAAVTVHQSIEKGQPVLVTGRLRTHQWDAESGPRTDLLLDATSLGHDLTRGVGKFTRATGDAKLTEPGGAPNAAELGGEAPSEEAPEADDALEHELGATGSADAALVAVG